MDVVKGGGFELGCQVVYAVTEIDGGHTAIWQKGEEVGKGNKGSMERGAAGGYNLYHGGCGSRVDGHSMDMSR